MFGGAGGTEGGGSLLSGITPFAKGGVVAAPSYFPLGNSLGVAGERGAEAILPLARGTDGRLGVRAESSRAPMAVNVNISAQDAASFRRSEAYLSGMIARAVARGERNF
jgi:phage-related minor tail protein